MSPLGFHYTTKGYLKKYWQNWDMTRHVMYTVASTVPSKKRLPKMNAWFPLPIDGKLHSDDEVKDMFRKLKDKIQSHNANKRNRSKDNG